MTRIQFRVLYREFLFRVVDLELLSPEGDIGRLLGQFAALLVFLSLGFSTVPRSLSENSTRRQKIGGTVETGTVHNVSC